MSITVDARSHKVQTIPVPLDPLSFNTDSSWVHHGGTPQGVIAIVVGQLSYASRAGHDDEVISCTYGGIPMYEVSGSPFVQTLVGSLPFDANGFPWDQKWWQFHAFYLGGCVGNGDQTFDIDLGPGTIFGTYQCEVWTFNTSMGGIACEAIQTQQEATDHPSFNITSSHTGMVFGAIGTDADSITRLTATSGHFGTLKQDFGVITAAWGEYAESAAGAHNFAWTITTAFSVAPLQPCIEFGFTVYEATEAPCPGELANYWGILVSPM